MRKIIVLEHISLDGVIQAPGGPEEDKSASIVGSTGVILANYERAGAVQTGSQFK